MGDVGWTILVAVAMAIGLAGVVVPILPGLLVVWAAALVYGFAVGFGVLGWITMIVMTVGVVASLVTSVVIPKAAASEFGASGQSQVLGLVFGIVGFFVIPVIGLFVGALFGVFIGEYLRLDEGEAAWRATKAVARGFGKSVLIDIVLGVAMVLVWGLWATTVVF